MVFVFGSVYVVNYIYRLAYVEPALHPRDESYLIMMNKFFDLLVQSACQYFIEDFCIYAYHGYWPEISFLIESLLGFCINEMILEGFPLFGLFGIVSEGMWYQLLFVCLLEFGCEPIQTWAFFGW